jgi:hypothetical protein
MYLDILNGIFTCLLPILWFIMNQLCGYSFGEKSILILYYLMSLKDIVSN